MKWPENVPRDFREDSEGHVWMVDATGTTVKYPDSLKLLLNHALELHFRLEGLEK